MANREMRLNEKQIIRAALAVSNMTQKKVSESVGINPNTLKNQLGRPDNTMTLISVYRLLSEMGFEIVVRDKDGKYGGKEYIVSEDVTRIAEQIVDDKKESERIMQAEVDAIKSEMKPPKRNEVHHS